MFCYKDSSSNHPFTQRRFDNWLWFKEKSFCCKNTVSSCRDHFCHSHVLLVPAFQFQVPSLPPSIPSNPVLQIEQHLQPLCHVFQPERSELLLSRPLIMNVWRRLIEHRSNGFQCLFEIIERALTPFQSHCHISPSDSILTSVTHQHQSVMTPLTPFWRSIRWWESSRLVRRLRANDFQQILQFHVRSTSKASIHPQQSEDSPWCLDDKPLLPFQSHAYASSSTLEESSPFALHSATESKWNVWCDEFG